MATAQPTRNKLTSNQEWKQLSLYEVGWIPFYWVVLTLWKINDENENYDDDKKHHFTGVFVSCCVDMYFDGLIKKKTCLHC